MRMRPFHLGLAAAAVTLGTLLVHAGSSAPLAKGVMQEEVKYLQTELNKAKVLKKAERKIRMSAVLLAAAAKATGKDGEGIAADALKIAKIMDGGAGHEEAKKLIADIAAGKGSPGKLPAYNEVLEFEFLMRVFSSEKVGGFGLEKELEDLVEAKGDLSAADAQKAANLAAKIALIGDISQHYFPPEKESGAKTKKAWNAFSQDMTKAANALGTAAAAKKGAEVGKLADTVSMTCVACHDVFR